MSPRYVGSLSVDMFACVYMHVYVRGRIVTLETPLLSSLGFSSLFSVHFLTACRTARYGDQMRADRVSSIVYTLKKPLLLTSITIYFPSSSASALFLFRFSNSLSLSLFVSLSTSLFVSFIRKELPAVKRLLSRCERHSSVRIDRILLFLFRRFKLHPAKY